MKKKTSQTNGERSERVQSVLKLSHALSDPHHPQAILAEGNTSVRVSPETFLVKASGSTLGTLRESDLVECRFEVLLPLLASKGLTDAEVDATLMKSRVDVNARKPSVEALFHAYFLTLPGIEYVGHTHAPAVNGLLCSPRAKEFAVKRLFPDEIVCCDVESVFVPYVDPGLKLAQAIAKETDKFVKKWNRPPRVILLKNHGVIALGRTGESVLAALLMAEKAATIWIGAAALGGPVFLTPENVARISGRPDEAMRRKILKM